MFKKIIYTLLFIFIFFPSVKMVGKAGSPPLGDCPAVHLEVERLPDMNMARSGHILLNLGDEILAAGGHTDGFVPTATAEYYKDGEWHLLDMVYAHDDGFAVAMKSGKVLIGGGHEKSLGIGQTYPVELYDPSTHTFKGFSCLDTNRALCRALELDSGKVVICGNHYNDDSFELFDGMSLFTKAGTVSTNRCSPHLLRSGRSDAVVFGKYDEKMRKTEDIRLDRLSGGSCEIDLLSDWTPFMSDTPMSSDISFIGNEETGDYRYILAGEKKDGRLQLVCVHDTVFTPIRTRHAIPETFEGEKITYTGSTIVDRNHQLCYLRGFDRLHRIFLLCLPYSDLDNPDGVPLTFYYTEPMPDVGSYIPVVTSCGDLLIAGGIIDSNFSPFKSVVLLKTGISEVTPCGSHLMLWLAVLLASFIISGIAFGIWRHRRKHRAIHPARQASSTETDENTTIQPISEVSTPTPSEPDSILSDNNASDELFARICILMEEEKMFLKSDLKLTDVSKALGTNNTYVSTCIKSQKGCSFSQFVNRYRVEYAKKEMQGRRGEKLSTIGMESGFSNETSFFRAFKQVTGMTPGEWLNSVEEG